MFCSNCGKQVADSARFCKYCGASIHAPVPTAQPAPVMPYTPAPNPTPVVAPTPVVVPQVTPAPVVVPEEPVTPVKKKKKKLLPLLLILALVVAAAAVAAFFLFGKKTVYLMTESVNTNANGPVTTSRYEYDNAGRITKYEYSMDYPESFAYAGDIQYEISYEYDSKGKLISAEFESDGHTLEVEYVYEKNVLTGFELDDPDGKFTDPDAELKVKCDDNGHFKYIAFLDEDGEELQVWEFKYHDNGTVKESRHTNPYSIEVVSRFNEEGQTTETTCYIDGQQQYRTTYGYNEKGLQTVTKQYDQNDELIMCWKYEFTYKKDQITDMSMIFEVPGEDGDMIEVEITFEGEFDGDVYEFKIDKIDADAEILEEMGFNSEDVEINYALDKNGNLLKMEIIAAGKVVTSTTNEYEAYKVSRSYKKTNFRSNPLYLFFLFNA